MTSPQASVDGPGVVLGVVGTGGAVTALVQDEWLWAAVIFLGSIAAELILVLARRRRGRRARAR
ncbi:hypothetical protein [Geodermatophilus sp. CPCC 206100]|uniref:hypothetical protein n=1 Tax=Geodermatophilus sp. CPCC 206100 TaxID=3020054 RepID=UPI003AFFBF68